MSENNDNKKKEQNPEQPQEQKRQNEKKGDKKEQKPITLRFNLNILYLLIGMLLLGLMFFNDDSSSQREVSYGEFQQFVRNGYVNRVIGYDDNTVEAYIKQQYVQQVLKEAFRDDGSTFTT